MMIESISKINQEYNLYNILLRSHNISLKCL